MSGHHESGTRCLWCGGEFHRHDAERPSAFERRKHCDRSCQVATQNGDRARRNRVHAAVSPKTEGEG